MNVCVCVCVCVLQHKAAYWLFIQCMRVCVFVRVCERESESSTGLQHYTYFQCVVPSFLMDNRCITYSACAPSSPHLLWIAVFVFCLASLAGASALAACVVLVATPAANKTVLSPIYTASTRPTLQWNGLPENYKFDPFKDSEHDDEYYTKDNKDAFGPKVSGSHRQYRQLDRSTRAPHSPIIGMSVWRRCSWNGQTCGAGLRVVLISGCSCILQDAALRSVVTGLLCVLCVRAWRTGPIWHVDGYPGRHHQRLRVRPQGPLRLLRGHLPGAALG